MPTPTHTTRIKAVPPTATPPAQPTPATPKPPLRDRLARLLPGFNVNSVLLLILIVMLAINTWGSAPEYKYDAINVTRERIAISKEWAGNRAKKGLGYNPDFIPEGWEYVGQLCNDGVNAAWILIRKPK